MARYWRALVAAVGGFLDEAAFRCELVFDVLRGRIPKEVPRRPWNRDKTVPVLVDVHSWTDDRLIASILVWPPLESEESDAAYDHHERTEQIKTSFEMVCSDLAWQTYFESDYGLQWSATRECWETSDGYLIDGSPGFLTRHHDLPCSLAESGGGDSYWLNAPV